jgi:hypothetical protein
MVVVLLVLWRLCSYLHTAVAPATEFNKITSKTAIGFILMGFIGFFVKLIFIVSTARVSGAGGPAHISCFCCFGVLAPQPLTCDASV